RVRSLTAINSLNFFLSACMLFLATIRETSGRNMLFGICVEAAAPLRPKVYFFYYRLVEGLHFILSKARTGIRGFFKPLRPNQRQMKIQGFT
ncbi:MAG: transposase, partial [Oscillospiraceae bacterium]|nr:transposase [Oscillospiraceae bacterium]